MYTFKKICSKLRNFEKILGKYCIWDESVESKGLICCIASLSSWRPWLPLTRINEKENSTHLCWTNENKVTVGWVEEMGCNWRLCVLIYPLRCRIKSFKELDRVDRRDIVCLLQKLSEQLTSHQSFLSM